LIIYVIFDLEDSGGHSSDSAIFAAVLNKAAGTCSPTDPGRAGIMAAHRLRPVPRTHRGGDRTGPFGALGTGKNLRADEGI